MNRLIKTPKLVYVPEIAAIPGWSAYTWTEQVFDGYTSDGNGSKGIPYLDSSGKVSYIFGGSGGRPKYRTVVHHVAAKAGVPGTPARTEIRSSIGWNGGARSALELPQDGYFQLTLPARPAGIVVGLSNGAYDHSYGHASHAVVIRGTELVPLRNGFALAAPMACPSGAVVRFERRAGAVSVLVDGESAYTFAAPNYGRAFGDVTLYGMADYVDDAEIGSFAASVIGSLPRLKPAISDSVYSFVDGQVPLMTLSAYCKMMQGVNGLAPAFVGGIGEGRHCLVAGLVPVPQLSARSNAPERVSPGVLSVMPPHTLLGLSYTGGTADMVAVLPALTGKAADAPFCTMDSVWGGHYTMESWEPYLPDGMVDGRDLLFVGDIGFLNNAVLIAVYDGISITDTLEIVLLVSLEAYDYLGIGSAANFSSVIELLAYERVAVNSGTNTAKNEAIQYAVNAITGALTTYQNFNFTQFARAGSETYAIRADGLYCLRGDSDAGAALNAVIDFGGSDYGTAQSKRMSSVYAGISTDGQVYIRLSGDNGEERVYLAAGESTERRALVAKGAIARHWRLRLELTGASYADLDNIEVLLGVSQRRLRGGK